MALLKFTGECKRVVKDGRHESMAMSDKGRDHIIETLT